MGVLFSLVTFGKHPISYKYIRILRDWKALVWFLVAIGFMEVGGTIGKLITSRFWNFFPLSLLCTFGGLFSLDNAAIVEIINNQTLKHQGIMVLLRDLVLSSLRHNILFWARHIPGLINSHADYISRSQVAKFKEISPEANQFPTSIPEILMLKSWGAYLKSLLSLSLTISSQRMYQRAWEVFGGKPEQICDLTSILHVKYPSPIDSTDFWGMETMVVAWNPVSVMQTNCLKQKEKKLRW